jgi:hypothetical protein
LLRREAGGEVEFVTIMQFDSLYAVRAFAGEDYEVAVVPEKAKTVLARFDGRSQHYEIRIEERGSSALGSAPSTLAGRTGPGMVARQWL